MTGKYLISFCKKLFFVFAHTCPFRRLRRHLPRVRGRLTFPILFFLGEKSFTVSWKRNSLMPSFLSGEQNRNDNKRKNRLLERAKNPARDTHNAYTDIKIWILYSLAVCCPRLRGKCRVLRGERGECAYTGKHLLQFNIYQQVQLFCVSHFPVFWFCFSENRKKCLCFLKVHSKTD